jgi:hypothetical protein
MSCYGRAIRDLGVVHIDTGENPLVVGHVANEHARWQRLILDQRRRGQHVVPAGQSTAPD